MRKIIFIFILSFCAFARGGMEDEDELLLGDGCVQNEDCEHINNATCNFYVCECVEGYVESSNNSVCLPMATKIGDRCEIAAQCSNITSAECIDKTCVIAQAITTIPPPVTKPKDECTNDSQCSTLLLKRVCKNGTCVLDIPPVAPRNIGFDVFVLGKPCVNNTECSAEGAACVDKMCKCVENFVPSQNLKMCLPKAKSVGDKCVETAQCLALNGSICENEKCSQKITRFLNNIGEKIPTLLIGSACLTDNECKHMTHALCLEKVCQCEESYVTSITANSCLEKAKKEGDPCEIDKQCENIKGSTCIQNKCVKPGIVGTKLGKQSSGSTKTVSKLILGAILLTKFFSF